MTVGSTLSLSPRETWGGGQVAGHMAALKQRKGPSQWLRDPNTWTLDPRDNSARIWTLTRELLSFARYHAPPAAHLINSACAWGVFLLLRPLQNKPMDDLPTSRPFFGLREVNTQPPHGCTPPWSPVRC